MSGWFDPQWVRAFQDAVAGAAGFWRAVAFLGDEEFYLLLFPFLYWVVSARLGLRLGLALLASVQVNGVLKLALHRPRPFWVDAGVRALAEEHSFGAPSGHSQNAAVLWGRWAWAGSRAARAAAAGLTLLIGLSRVALGVHFWGDVLLGWAVGAVLLGAVVRLEPRLQAWVSRRGPWPAVGGGLGLAALVVGLALALRAAFAATTPPAWAAAWSLDGVLTAAGTWSGLLVGWAWLRGRGGFDAAGPWRQRGLRLVVGWLGLFALWAGLRALFPVGEGWVPAVARGVRYGLVGFWIAGAAPWLFRRWGWATAARGILEPPGGA